MKKSVLITGANKGIGFEIARQLGALGWQIWLGARNPEKGRNAEAALQTMGFHANFVEMDVSVPKSIEAAFAVMKQHSGKLDALINNAGILLREDRSLLRASPDLVQLVLQTNAIGALQVVQVFSPLLEKGSRVLFMSSGGGSMSGPVGGWAPVYCISKTLVNGIVRQLAHELGSRGIPVHAVGPGWVKTDMGGHGASRSVEQGADTAVWLATDAPDDQTGLFWRDRRVIPW
ncbi:MAG: SDR family NAD(P)-dependent oxidoreductase [Lewinellaceae bacterium]|nr:SDR family NAD(P)-dependent oxidoreductase [Lewinellaceae bacterium]